MKKTLYVILALVALAIFVFWILPAALHLLLWAAFLLGVAFAVYTAGRHFWRKKRTRLAVGGQAKTERRAHQTAEKSLKELERNLAASAEKTPPL